MDLPAAEDQLQRALALAFRHLNRRERTCAEMRDHLLGRDVDPAVADATLAALREQGYLDDARFARLFAEDKRDLQHWGTERIARELRARGIDPELVEQVAGGGGGEGELDRALCLLRERFPAPLRDRRQRERALGVLLRRGYDYEVASDALSIHRRD